MTTQPGHEGARHRVSLSLRVAHRLFLPPDQQDQLTNHLPAYPVGSRRAHVHVACVVDSIDDRVSSADPPDTLQRFTHAVHEVLACGRAKTHMSQRQWGRLEPTPALQYRAHEVMRTTPLLST